MNYTIIIIIIIIWRENVIAVVILPRVLAGKLC